MSTPAQSKMTVDEFLVWAEGQPGRWERYNGVPYAMAPERTRHGEIKFAVQIALLQGIRRAILPCHMLPDGATVRVSQHTAHEPDALVYCGVKLPADAVHLGEQWILNRHTHRAEDQERLEPPPLGEGQDRRPELETAREDRRLRHKRGGH